MLTIPSALYGPDEAAASGQVPPVFGAAPGPSSPAPSQAARCCRDTENPPTLKPSPISAFMICCRLFSIKFRVASSAT